MTETVSSPHNRFRRMHWLFPIVGALIFVLFPLNPVKGNERTVPASNAVNNALTFLSDKAVAPDSLPPDSYHIALTRKSGGTPNSPSMYSFILRGIDPVEKALLQDSQSGNGKWERFDLFRAVMIVEGIRDIERIRGYEARLNQVVAQVLAQKQPNTTQQDLARNLFEAMHREVLTKPYRLDCTEVSKVLDTGHFNCVSATILFNYLAEKVGLDVYGLEMPGHALTGIRYDNGEVARIETTCPHWFSLTSEQDRQWATMTRIAPAHATPEQPTARNMAPAEAPLTELPANFREISPVQLTATVYYNIGVDLHAKKKYPEAAAANIKALNLDSGNERAWSNLLASLNNWALEWAKKENGNRYDVAIFTLDQGYALDPSYANFRVNYTYVFYLWIDGLANLGRFDEARRVFDSAEKRIPGEKVLHDLIAEVKQMELRIKNSRAQ